MNLALKQAEAEGQMEEDDSEEEEDPEEPTLQVRMIQVKLQIKHEEVETLHCFVRKFQFYSIIY